MIEAGFRVGTDFGRWDRLALFSIDFRYLHFSCKLTWFQNRLPCKLHQGARPPHIPRGRVPSLTRLNRQKVAARLSLLVDSWSLIVYPERGLLVLLRERDVVDQFSIVFWQVVSFVMHGHQSLQNRILVSVDIHPLRSAFSVGLLQSAQSSHLMIVIRTCARFIAWWFSSSSFLLP